LIYVDTNKTVHYEKHVERMENSKDINEEGE
jgi:hypothetical protein